MLFALAFAAGVFAPGHGARAAGWYNSSWTYRDKITINSSQVAGSATSFPALINTTLASWKYTSYGGRVGSATGWDFVITVDDGTTKLDHEIESYASSTGAFVGWVRIPFLSSTSNTVLYIYYGNAAAGDQQNKTGVWDASYKGVWHLRESSNPYRDSTSNGYDSSGGTYPTATSTGQIDGAQTFDGSTTYVTTGGPNLQNASITLSAWIYPTEWFGNPSRGRIIAGDSSYALAIDNGNISGGLLYTSNNAGAGSDYIDSNPNVISLNSWQYVVVTFDNNNTAKFYVNGSTASAGSPNYWTQVAASVATYLGDRSNGDRKFAGTLDEIRASNVIRSASWIQTEYNSQSSPSTFYNIEEPGRGVQVSSRSDTLSDSRPSATSNHTVAFKVNNAIYGSSLSGSSTLTLALDSAFTIPVGMDCGDVDAATSVQFNFNYPGCQATATAWGFSAIGSVITLVPPSGTGVYVPTSTQVTIKIGSNATFQQQGAHWITNPSSAGVYTISVGGTFGGSGNMLVSINAGQTVQATVAENLSFTASSVNAVNCTADDDATITAIGTTPTSVPFGNINSSTFYQGCQDLTVSTNAMSGYSLTVQEKTMMRTTNGLYTIPDTTCDAGNCSVATATTWVTPTKYGLGHTCFNQSGSDCNPTYGNGTKFKPLPNVAAGTNQSISLVNSWTIADNLCSGSSCSVTVSPVAGHTLLVGIEYRKDLATLNSVTDDQSETYAQLFNVTDGGNQYSVALYCLANAKSGVSSITANCSTNTRSTLLAAEYAGVTCNVDKTAFVTSQQVSPWSSGSITPVSGQSELIFGLNMNHNGTVPVTFTADSPFSSVARSGYSNNDGAYVFFSHLITGSTSGSYTASGTSSSGQNNPQIVALMSSGIPSALMLNSGPVANSTGRAKYRLSASPNQPAGTYTTVIMYTLTPTY